VGPVFSLREWERNDRVVAEEYCWVTTQEAGRSCCGRSCSGALESLISGGLPCTYTYIVDTMYTQFRLGEKYDFVRNLADRNCWVSLGMSVHVCTYPKNVIRKHCSCAKCVVKIDFCKGSRGKYPSILHPTKGGSWVTGSRPIYLLPPPPPPLS